ncbi:sodium:calcium antiporter [Domibacillus robiginosus]|uniref:sodium:calcium antiporter n=1 Tax=Domibacillus robiginosus TaxID=1071054 RepID=UPI00067E5DC7|nr:sodium:calcium antiporter [Domibacillus robiginosus]
MLFLLFGTAAASVILATIALSNYTKVLGSMASLGGMLIGTVLLASATTLPEATASISAVLMGNPDIAIGNMLGSNLFNLLIIAVADLWYWKRRVYQSVKQEHTYTAGLGLLLSVLSLLALMWQSDYVVFRFGLDTLAMIFIYFVSMYFIRRTVKTSVRRTDLDDSFIETAGSPLSFKKAISGFLGMAFLITAMGTTLSFVSNEIVEVTGVGSSFIGSFLLAAATSIPEAITVFASMRLKNINLALGSVLGSNIFNILILLGLDAFYMGGPIFSHRSPVHQATAAAISVLSLVLVLALRRKEEVSAVNYILPSLLMFFGYFYAFYKIFLE